MQTMQAQLQAHLGHRKIKLPHQLSLDQVERAIAACGVGLDHTALERVLAVGDDSVDDQMTRFFMLTDRRLAGRRSSHFFHVPVAEVARVESTGGLLNARLTLYTQAQAVDATIAPFVKPLSAYLGALCQLPPADRTPPPLPLPEPTEAALSSDGWLNEHAANLGAVCGPMLRAVTERFRRGELPHAEATDLVARVFLHGRAAHGRGMLNGWWLSPLPVGDLHSVLTQLLGEPAGGGRDGEVYSLDFSLGGGGAGKAAASTAAGLAALAVLGVGWVSRPGKSVRALRVSLSGVRGLTYFGVHGEDGAGYRPLSAVTPALLGRLLQALSQCEAQLLLRRCANV